MTEASPDRDGPPAPRPGAYDTLAPERVIWGRPAAEAVVEEADRLAAKRVFLVASRTLNTRTPVVERVRQALGARHVATFDGCAEHTPRETVIAAAEAARAADPDLVVTIGGGTAIDTVKVMLVCIAHGLTRTGELDDYHLRIGPDGNPVRPTVASPPYRQIAVPTTLSGAEYSNFGGCTDTARQVKDGYLGPEIGPRSVILDPAATLPTPQDLWLSTGIRAVDHAVESVCSIATNPLVDACALAGLRLFATALARTRTAPGDLAARMTCQHAAWLASTGIIRVPYGASHGIGHSLGAVTGMGHGHTSCVMLPQVLRWNRAATEPQQAEIARSLGRTDGDAAQAVADLVASLGQPGRLRDAGVRRDQLPPVAAGALDNVFVRANPRPITTVAEIEEILDMAW